MVILDPSRKNGELPSHLASHGWIGFFLILPGALKFAERALGYTTLQVRPKAERVPLAQALGCTRCYQAWRFRRPGRFPFSLYGSKKEAILMLWVNPNDDLSLPTLFS